MTKTQRLDFLFVLFTPEFEGSLRQACEQNAHTYRLITNLDEAQNALNHDQYRCVWIEMREQHPFGLQLLEWMGTQNLASETGVLFVKGYDENVKKALRLGARHFISHDSLASPNVLQRCLSHAKSRYESLRTKNIFQFGKSSSESVNQVWLAASLSSRQILESVKQAYFRGDALCFCGPEGVGKTYLVQCLLAELAPDFTVFWDAGVTESYTQKAEFLAKTKGFQQDGQWAWVIEEIGQLDLDLQELLLEFLRGEGWLFESQRVWPDCRIFITSSQSLEDLLEQRLLNDDLYQILSQNQFFLPPLSMRREDVHGLADYFVENFSMGLKRMSRDAVDILQNYDWPRGVGELSDCIRNLCQTVPHGIIGVQDLPQFLLVQNFYSTPQSDESFLDLPYQEAKKRTLHKFNNTYMKHLLDISQQNLTVAAEKAGMDRSNFKKLLKKV